MQPPRWFYSVLAICAVVVTVSVTAALVSLTYRLRYTTDPEHGALIDHWHRTYCLTGGCVPFDDSAATVTPSDSLAATGTASVPAFGTRRDSALLPGQMQREPAPDSMLQPPRLPR